MNKLCKECDDSHRYVSKIAMFTDAVNRRGGAGNKLGREAERELRVSVLRNEHFVRSIEVGGVDIVSKAEIEDERTKRNVSNFPIPSFFLYS